MKVVNKKISSPATKCLAKQKLRGSDYPSFQELRKVKLEQYKHQYSSVVLDHLLMSYGSDIDAFLKSIEGMPELQKAICSTQADLLGQVVWAIEKEQALTLNDIIFGRTSLGLLGIQTNELLGVAELMSQHLGWSTDEMQRQIGVTSQRLDKTQAAIRA